MELEFHFGNLHYFSDAGPLNGNVNRVTMQLGRERTGPSRNG